MHPLVPSESNLVSALSSALRSEIELLVDVNIDGEFVMGSLIYTNATCSIVPLESPAKLGIIACVVSLIAALSEVLGILIGRASVCGYIDVLVVINGFEIQHQLIVVEELALTLVIVTDEQQTRSLNRHRYRHCSFKGAKYDLCVLPRLLQ